MKIVLAAACLSVCAAAAFAGDSGDRGKLAGTWQIQTDQAKGNVSVWVFEDKGDVVHVSRFAGADKVADFECNTAGRECGVKVSGHKATVSMWYNGAKLVQMETNGAEVVKRRFAVSDQGDVLEIETVPLTPPGATETLRFKRVAAASK